MKKYYGLFDCQLGGFKANYASENYQKVLEMGAERACDLSQSDTEPCPPGLLDIEILNLYGYEVKEISEEQYQKILKSDEIGLLTTVSM